MIIVDTTVWVDYLRGLENRETNYLHRELSHQPLGLTDLILCETLQGIPDEDSATQVFHELHRFHIFETGGEEMAVLAARNFRKLRQQGRTVRKTIDCLIATFCLQYGHSLLHRDRDFDHFERILNLSVVHP